MSRKLRPNPYPRKLWPHLIQAWRAEAARLHDLCQAFKARGDHGPGFDEICEREIQLLRIADTFECLLED